MRTRTIVFATLALVAGLCAATVIAREHVRRALVSFAFKDRGVYVDDGVPVFDTYISTSTVAEFIELYRGLESKPTYIKVRSVGGEIDAGMDLAEFIRANQLDVHVIDYCVSSCANYVFPAGRRKIIGEGAMIVWHGSAIQEGVGEDLAANYECLAKETCDEEIRALQEEFTRYIEEASQRQQRLYTMLGVDEMITVFGQQVAKCRCNWTFSTEDMRRFGIEEISVVGAEYFAETPWRAILIGVEKLRLADYPEYRSRS